MGFALFAGRLVLLLGLYGMAFAVAQTIWRGLPEASGKPVAPRSALLRLVKAVGVVSAAGTTWAEGSDLALPLPIALGRQEGNAVRIEDPFVSSCHAELITDGSVIWLVDRGSKNGTWVGGTRLERPVRVAPGDEFRLGGTVIRLEE